MLLYLLLYLQHLELCLHTTDAQQCWQNLLNPHLLSLLQQSIPLPDSAFEHNVSSPAKNPLRPLKNCSGCPNPGSILSHSPLSSALGGRSRCSHLSENLVSRSRRVQAPSRHHTRCHWPLTPPPRLPLGPAPSPHPSAGPRAPGPRRPETREETQRPPIPGSLQSASARAGRRRLMALLPLRRRPPRPTPSGISGRPSPRSLVTIEQIWSSAGRAAAGRPGSPLWAEKGAHRK